MSICKKCGAAIVWIKTPKGSAMPCNAEPVFYADSKEDPQSKKDDTIVSYDGIVHKGMIMSTEKASEYEKNGGIVHVGNVPHWASCPYADSFRRKGK